MSISKTTQSTSENNLRVSPPSVVSSFCWFVITYLILFLRWGYSFGSGDQVEILPYALKMLNPSLYSNDLFISTIFANAFNQRWAVASLLSFFGDYIPLGSFVLFSVCLFFVVRGILLLAHQLNLSSYAAFTAVIALLLVTQGFSPGGNDLYGSSFTADSLSIPLIIFGFWFALKRHWLTAGLLVGLATLFQPLMGFQVFILLGISAIFLTKSWKIPMQMAVVYVLFGGWIFGMLALAVFTGTEVPMSNYYEVYFRFRAPHHFIPSFFITWKAILFFIFMVWATFKWYSTEVFISSILSIIGIGGLVYLVSVHFFDSQLIASTQWFKTMQWAKIFIVIALLIPLDSLLRKIQAKMPSSIVLYLAISSLIGLVLLFKFPNMHPLKKQNSIVQESPNYNMFSYVKMNIPESACFIIPVDNTDFKYGAQRSVYVDYKSIDPKPTFVQIWNKRITEVYGRLSKDTVGFEFYAPATIHYNSLSNQDLAYLKSKGVSHALFNHQKLNNSLKLLYQDAHNFIYALEF